MRKTVFNRPDILQRIHGEGVEFYETKMALSFMKQNRLIVVLAQLCFLLELNWFLLYHSETTREDDPAERARAPPVRDKFSRLNAQTLSDRLHTGNGRQTSQTTFIDVLEEESLQQVDRLQGKIRSDLFVYLHAAVLSLQKSHVSQKTDETAIWRKSDLDLRIEPSRCTPANSR